MTKKNGETLVHDLKSIVDSIETQMHRCIIGQANTIKLLTIALLCGGHCILHGVPGLAKTLIVSALARIFNIRYNRIQFTPDVMPSDITGTEIIDEDSSGKKSFRFISGPIFANIILADEINRAPSKTQSALLEAMQEHAVTVFGKRYELEYPFFVFATQNPIEQEGTYSLPEAQLDRFLFNIILDYPSFEEEVSIAAKKNHFDQLQNIESILNKEQLKQYQEVIEEIPISNPLIEYIVNIVKNTRPSYSKSTKIKNNVSYGAGPRATQYIVIASKAHAAISGRYAVNKADIQFVTPPILNHRIILNYSAFSENLSVYDIIEEAIAIADK